MLKHEFFLVEFSPFIFIGLLIVPMGCFYTGDSIIQCLLCFDSVFRISEAEVVLG